MQNLWDGENTLRLLSYIPLEKEIEMEDIVRALEYEYNVTSRIKVERRPDLAFYIYSVPEDIHAPLSYKSVSRQGEITQQLLFSVLESASLADIISLYMLAYLLQLRR